MEYEEKMINDLQMQLTNEMQLSFKLKKSLDIAMIALVEIKLAGGYGGHVADKAMEALASLEPLQDGDDSAKVS